ncbi:hypothetical protein ACIQVK_32985 [Streptomyces sp. NPDC090493]|uniref:hypothetical protein n=1 Tax=Streptomyces sp. NPDC090493 TaxID=3365964 RepID=UPI00380783CD
MFKTSSGLRVLGRAGGAIGALCLVALGAMPAASAAPVSAASADDPSAGVVLGRMASVDGVEPGGTVQVPVGFTNTGTEALRKVWLTYTLSHGLARPDRAEPPSNCTYSTIAVVDGESDRTEVICEFDRTVRPGVVHAPGRQLAFPVRDSASYEVVAVKAEIAGHPYPGDNFTPEVPGTAPAVEPAERPDATPAPAGSAENSRWDVADVPVTAVNTADFRVTGARLRGGVGDTVPLTVSFTDAGPGWVQRRDRADAARIVVKMPSGTTVTRADPYCHSTGSGEYVCGVDFPWVEEGYERSYAFRLRIDKAVPGARGSVGLIGASRPFDTDAGNDEVGIRLDVTGTAKASGGGTANSGAGTALPLVGAAAATLALGAGAVLVVRRRASGR